MYLNLQYEPQAVGLSVIQAKMQRMRFITAEKVYNFEHLPPVRWLMNSEGSLDRLPAYATAGYQCKSGSQTKAIYMNESGWWIGVDGPRVSFSGAEFLLKMFWTPEMTDGLEQWAILSPTGKVITRESTTVPWQ